MLFALPTPASGPTRPEAPTSAIARMSGLGAFFLPWSGAIGTELRAMAHTTVVRSGFHGWLAERAPVIFQAERKEPIGTAFLSPINPRVRAGFHGWFAARTAEIFPKKTSTPPIGTAAVSGYRKTVVRSGFHGWFAERAPVIFMADAESSAAQGYHLPVLPAETAQWIAAGPGKYIIDGTLGGGGHSEAMLEAGARVLGVDRDPEAIAHASHRLARFGGRFQAWQGNFADLHCDPEVQGGERADGLLLDLGVSSRQLDAAARGFSFMREGPLDMRMGPASRLTAADVVNTYEESEIVRILRKYGEEPQARRIAAAIVRERSKAPFVTTTDLANCIERALGRSGKTHPATRAFQAIRIEVNDEFGSLRRALEEADKLLKPGGRFLIITFHSLEDRMVKQFFRDRSREWIDKPEWPEPRPNPSRTFRLPVSKAIAPTAEEIRTNPRARSAKLRVAELLDPKHP